jgi:ribosomal protein S18 acetylase RimI-like enzyme
LPLRPAQAADAPAITRIFQAARAHSLAYLPIVHSDAEDHAFFARTVQRGGVTVAESGGAVVAFLALDEEEIDHLYVDPRHQRQGHGAALLGHAQGARAHLELWVFQRNQDAIAFYEAHGFAIVDSTDGADNEEHEPDHRMAWSVTTRPGTAPAPTQR